MVLLLFGTLASLVVFISLWPHVRKILLKSNLYNVAGPPRASFWKGNLGQLFNQKGWEFHREIVQKYGGAVKIHGLCGDEQVYVSDPKALYHIVAKDQDAYEETRYFIISNLVCFGKGMVSVIGEQHRKQRKMFHPVFNVSHIRALTPIFYRITNDLCGILRQIVTSDEGGVHGENAIRHKPRSGVVIDMLRWTKRTALEYIGQAGLGYSFGPLDSMEGNAYSDSVKNFAPTLFRLSILRQFLPTLQQIGTPALQRWVVDRIPIERVQRLKEIVDVMHNTSKMVLEQKKRALGIWNTEGKVKGIKVGGNPQGAEKTDMEFARTLVGEGKDIMSILLQENIKADEQDRLSDEEVLGQMTTLVFAGQDSTSAGICTALYELASHPDAQERLRAEVTEARSAVAGGEVAYDDLDNLPFLDAVCRETLRLHPPIYMLHRTTQRDIVLPLSKPVLAADGTTLLHSIPLKRNQNVIIAIEAANRNCDIWGADAQEWIPERWLRPLPDNDGETKLPGVYSSMMTFLGGGRSCIGFKFALTELKIVLSALIASFHFELAPNTEYEWKLGGIVSPGVKDDPVPKVPLLVSLCENRQRDH